MQKKKIVIEIPVPKQVRRKIMQSTAKWADLPMKWMKEENLHLTVSFIGYVDESVLPDICQQVSDAAAQIESFDIEFDHIALGPNEDDPHMLWLTGEASEELRQLNEAIEKALGTFSRSRKQFRPHLTLGKLRKGKWEELPEKPKIHEKLHVTIPVDAVSVMQSDGVGAEYSSIEDCLLA